MHIAEWEDEELLKSWQEKMSLQDKTLSRTLHISDAKWAQEIEGNSTRGQ